MITLPADERTKILQVLRDAMNTEKGAADGLMHQKWSDERDTFANQHYYAADVLQDAIEQIEALE